MLGSCGCETDVGGIVVWHQAKNIWISLDQEIREYTAKEGMMYIRDDNQQRSPFGEPPVVCNYFHHEEVRKSAKKEK